MGVIWSPDQAAVSAGVFENQTCGGLGWSRPQYTSLYYDMRYGAPAELTRQLHPQASVLADAGDRLSWVKELISAP